MVGPSGRSQEAAAREAARRREEEERERAGGGWSGWVELPKTHEEDVAAMQDPDPDPDPGIRGGDGGEARKKRGGGADEGSSGSEDDDDDDLGSEPGPGREPGQEGGEELPPPEVSEEELLAQLGLKLEADLAEMQVGGAGICAMCDQQCDQVWPTV